MNEIAEHNSRVGAIDAYAHKSSLPILRECDGGNFAVQGTGSVFRIADRYFLITAAHTLVDEDTNERYDPATFLFPDETRTGNLIVFGSMDLHWPKIEAADIVVIELKNRETIDIITANWNVLTLESIGNHTQSEEFALFGYLFEGARVNDRGDIFQKGLAFRSFKLEHVPEGATYDERFDVFFALPETADDAIIDPEKKGSTEGKVPRLKGASGCSIWALIEPDTAFWDPSVAMKVVAVQSTARPGDFFRGIDWEVARAILRDIGVV